MNRPTIYIHGDAQDGVGNTINKDKIVVYERDGDIVGYSMRGGMIFIREDIGLPKHIGERSYRMLGGADG